MKKSIIYLIKIVIISFILSLSSIKICYAEVDSNALQGYFNGLSNQAINQSSNPKYAERNASAETIDPITGNLVLKQTDLTLPGRDGLDLTIGRIYSSSRDEYDKKALSKYVFYTDGWVCIVTKYIKNTETFVSSFTNGPYANATVADIDINYYKSLYSSDPNYDYEFLKAKVSGGTCLEISNLSDRYSYEKTRYYLGAGWSFAFPSVQIETDINDTYIYFHDGNGATYKVTGTTDNGTSNLDGYQGKDVKFLGDNGTYINGDNIPSKYKFITSDLKTYYFAEDGRLLGIKDRFNNEITFRHVNTQIYDKTFPLISSIKDSIGRIITFSYVGDYINISVTAPGESKSLQLSYKRSFITKYVTDPNFSSETYQYPILESYTDTLGRTTHYENYSNYNNGTWAKEKFSFISRDLSSLSAVSVDHYLLGAIVYPGSKTLYEYEKITRNLGSDGTCETYRVKARYDTLQRKNINTNAFEWLPACNRIDYTYGGDYTAYPDYYYTLPVTYQFWSQAAASNGLKTKSIFNGNMQLIQTESMASNNEKKVTKYLEFDTNYKFLPTKTETSEYASDSTLARTLYTGTVYTTWGGVSSETMPLTLQQYNDAVAKSKYTVNYYYSDAVYKYFLTKKEWYQNSNTLLNETYTYNSLGRAASYKNAKGEITSYSYSTDASNNKIVDSSISIEGGKIAKTRLIYGAGVACAFPTEEIKYYTNDSGINSEIKIKKNYSMLLGLVITETDNENKTTTYTYDNAGRILTIQYPGFTNINGGSYSVGQEYQYIEGYNEEYTEGNCLGIYGTTVTSCTTYTNSTTKVKSYYNQMNSLYDAYGNLRQERVWDGSQYITQSKYIYDNLLRVVSLTDVSGNTVTQSYNPWGQVNEVVDALGNLYLSGYDVKTNKTMSYFVAKNNIVAYRANTSVNTYKEDYVEGYLDQFGRITSRKVFENWPALTGELSETYCYDIVGNLIGYTDPKRNINNDGYTSSYKYDALNRVTEVKDALNQLTSVTYNILGNISSVILKDSLSGKIVTLYTKAYDELGSLKSKTDAALIPTTFSYNTIGLNTKVTDRNGSIMAITYDWMKRMTETLQTSKENASSIKHRYNYTSPLGYDTEQFYSNGTLAVTESYTYNAYGQVTQKNITGSGYINSNIKMQYDAASNLTSIGTGVQNASYFYTDYTYANNRLSKVQTDGQQTLNTSDLTNASYEYYPDGRLKKITYPKLNDGTYLTTEYLYNALGRLTSMFNKKGSTILSQFSYTYDANGNILSMNDGQSVNTYVYDKLNRLTEIRLQNGNKTTYTYDLNGNRLTKSSPDNGMNYVNTTYSYDVENKLTAVSKGTVTTSMAYYADGLRAKKTTTSGSTYYVYDLLGRVVAEGQSASTVNANYVWGPDRVLSKKVVGGSDYYYLYNGHGDVIQIVDRNGNVVNNYKYDEWGNILQSSETISNPFKYAGEVYDQETGLYYLRARYYDPAIGRFINEDSYEGQIDNPLSTNLYTYCWNNPVIYADTTGNAPYRIGSPTQPKITFDNDFAYNPNAKATFADYRSWLWWDIKLTGAAFLRPDLIDACFAYSNYRNGDGSTLVIDYEKAYREDTVIKYYVDNEIISAQYEAERLYETSGDISFNITGGLVGIPNGNSENWQKTIGAHNIWGSATVKVENGVFTMTITIHEIDKYNFNMGMADIATWTPDEVNGRFEVLGWANSFITTGQLVRTITWAAGDIENTTTINSGGR